MTMNKHITLEVAAEKWFNELSWTEFTKIFVSNFDNFDKNACSDMIIIEQYKAFIINEKLKML